LAYAITEIVHNVWAPSALTNPADSNSGLIEADHLTPIDFGAQICNLMRFSVLSRMYVVINFSVLQVLKLGGAGDVK
jgi:hypothetical protein